MIIESIVIATLALGLDFAFGDPKNQYHPTSWIGHIIAKLVLIFGHQNATVKRIGGFFVILITVGIVLLSLAMLYLGVTFLSTLILNLGITVEISNLIIIIIPIVVGSLLLDSTIAIKGMKYHALSVINSLEQDNLDSARNNLAMIVKRNTTHLDKNHVISATLESIGESIVDGITGPFFYYAVFSVPGAFVYRVINTADSMIAYKNDTFKNIGWFTAICDMTFNFIPSRLTGLIIIVSALLLGKNWRSSYNMMIRDGNKTASPNAGYPMAALAGALEVKFEKINHYTLGDENTKLTIQHIKSAVAIMQVTSLLFFIIITIPIIIVLGWIFHV